MKLFCLIPSILYAHSEIVEISSVMGVVTSTALAYSLYLLYRMERIKKERDSAIEKQKNDSNILYLQSRYASMGETLANIAHQWKQPLNAIGTIQNSIKAALIFQGEISKEKLLHSVDTSFKLLQHLAETIDTFYSFLAQSGHAANIFFISDELEKVRKITEYSFQNSNISLKFELDINPVIQGNANEFTHALLNLILNAKDAFDTLNTENPTITVGVIGKEDMCTITVTDNAGGIRIKPIEMVFDLHITTKEDGSGLGLFMTKNIIEKRFGGTVSARNTKNGACFTIELPYAEYSERYETITRNERLTLDRINQLSRKVIELEEAKSALTKWADIFQHAHWGIAIHIGTSNTFELFNSSFNALYGYTPLEMKELSVPDLFPPETLPFLSNIQHKAFSEGYAAFETINRRKDGSLFPIYGELMVLKNDEGDILYHIANIWDQSEKKASEERLLLKKFALDHIRDAVFLIDEHARFHYVNEGSCHALGYTREELMEMNIGDVDPDWPSERWQEHWETLKKAGSMTMELRHRRKDGSIFPVEVSANYIEYNGHFYNMSVARDITERRLLEAEKENRIIKTVAENSPDVIIRYDLEGRRIYANPKAVELFGVVLGKSPSEATPIIDKELYVSELRKVIKTGIEATFEITYINAVGGIDYSHIRMVPEFDDSGKISSVLMIGRNITNEKLAFEALAQKERELRTLIENIPDNIARWDTHERYLYINAVHEQTLGVSAADVIGKTTQEIFPNGDFTVGENSIRQVLRTGEALSVRHPILQEDGYMGWHDVNYVPERDANGQIISVLGIGRDMTHIYRLQNEIAMREQELRALAESSPGMMGAFYMRPDGSVCMPYVSPNISELFGVTPEDVRDDATPLLALTHPDDSEHVQQIINESMQNMSLWHIEYRIIHPTKGIRWMEGNTMPQPHPEGGIVWYGYVHDITERKAMEASVQESNDRYLQILDNSTDVIYLLDVTPEGKYVYVDVNAAYETVTGIPRDVVIGLCVDEIEDEVFRAILIDKFDSCLNAGCDTDYTADYPFPGGVRTFHSILTPIRDESGRIVRIVGSARDITEQNELQKELQKERKFLSDAQRVAHTGSWYLDLIGGTLSWSDETYRMFELDKESVTDLHKTFYEYVHPEDREAVRIPYEETLKTKEPYELEHRVLMPDGRIKYVVERCEHVYTANGTPLYSIGTVQDITERKLIEKELEDSHAFLTKLIDSLPDPIFVKDREHKWLILNKANYAFAGIEPGTLIGKSDYDFFPKEEAEIFWEKDEEVFNSGKVNINEEYFTSSDGVTHYIQTIKAMFVGSDGKEYLVGTIRDLSERKAMEDDLRKALEFNEGVIGAIPDLLFEIAPDGTYVGVWAQNEKLLVQQRSALLGKNFKELMPPDVVIISLQAMKEVDEKGLSLGKTYRLDLPNGTRWFELSVTKKKMSGNYIALARDITERKRAEEALESNRNLLYTILESSPGVITFALDTDYRYLAFDSKHANVMRTVFGKEIAVGINIFEVIGDSEDAKIAKRSFDRALWGESFIAEEEYGDERLSHQYWQIFYSPIRAQTGEIIGLACFNVDITERKKAENEIRELNETLEERVKERTLQLMRALEFNEGIINALPDLLFEVDRHGRYMGVWTKNPQLLAAQKEVLLNHTFEEILSPEATAIAMEAIREAEEKGLSFGKVIEIELSDGIHWFELSASKKSSDGTFLFISRDISERKNSEKRLLMVETAINSSTEAIYISDQSLNIIYVNDGACRMLGYSREEMLDMSIIDIEGRYTNDEIHALKESTLKEPNLIFETRHRRKDGSIIDVEIVGTSFTYDNDEIFLSVVKEITERK